MRGSGNAPKGGAVPEPARPGSLPSGGAGTKGSGGGEALPGALALPGQSGEAPSDLSALLTPATGGAR